MSSLKKDVEKILDIIDEEKKIVSREEKLAQLIGEIEQIYQSTPRIAPGGEVMIHEVRYPYKSYSGVFRSEESQEPSLDIVISLGVRDWQDNKPAMYGDAWLRVEFFGAHPADDDKPIVSKEFILGRYQLGIKHNDEFVTHRTSNDSIDEHFDYIDEAIGLAARALHLGRASSTRGVE